MNNSSKSLFGSIFLLFGVIFTPFICTANPLPEEPVRVVATLPVLKDLAEVIGGKHIQATSLISGFESEHTYRPKPSDLVLIQKAKLLLKIGLGLEIWVDPLIANAARADLFSVTTSKGVELIDDDSNVAHADNPGADEHETSHHDEGNPHIWLDPENVKIMVTHIRDGLIKVDPVREEHYRINTAMYIEKLSELQKILQSKVAMLKTRAIITHHPAWPYFARRFGFHIKGNILKQIGSGASAKTIGKLIRKIKKEKIGVIVSEPQLNQKIPEILAEESGAKIVSLSPLPGAIPGTEHYLDLIRYNVETLVLVLEK